MERGAGAVGTESGYALAALLVMVSVMAVLLSTAMPVWTTMVQREREAELVFRGEQYARAIARYQQAFGNASPPSLDVLVDEGFLRRRYTDPVVPGAEFVPLTAAAVLEMETGVSPEDAGVEVGGIVGVTSGSTAESLREYRGARRYNQWLFLGTEFSGQAGVIGPPDGDVATEAPDETRP